MSEDCWDSMKESEDEKVEKEMETMEKIETLKGILNRLRELKQQGEEDGIEEKIAEVERTLQKYLKYY